MDQTDFIQKITDVNDTNRDTTARMDWFLKRDGIFSISVALQWLFSKSQFSRRRSNTVFHWFSTIYGRTKDIACFNYYCIVFVIFRSVLLQWLTPPISPLPSIQSFSNPRITMLPNKWMPRSCVRQLTGIAFSWFHQESLFSKGLAWIGLASNTHSKWREYLWFH